MKTSEIRLKSKDHPTSSTESTELLLAPCLFPKCPVTIWHGLKRWRLVAYLAHVAPCDVPCWVFSSLFQQRSAAELQSKYPWNVQYLCCDLFSANGRRIPSNHRKFQIWALHPCQAVRAGFGPNLAGEGCHRCHGCHPSNIDLVPYWWNPWNLMLCMFWKMIPFKTTKCRYTMNNNFHSALLLQVHFSNNQTLQKLQGFPTFSNLVQPKNQLNVSSPKAPQLLLRVHSAVGLLHPGRTCRPGDQIQYKFWV